MKHPLGDRFKPGEVLLAVINETPAFFLRIENIIADRKPDWWRLEFLVLTLPLVQTTWIVDDEQIRGAPFTMAGKPVRMERVKAPESSENPQQKEKISKDDQKQANVISLFDQKNK
ncbi:hypothetical protein GF407_01495 [candidate division KSB1 bacterium]|nr:hypothetical protein [candidate division KSB1 bacterium]